MQTIPSPSVPVHVRPRPLERLEAEIVELATQLTAATARLLTMIGEFDAAEGWREWGMRSTAHWLSWKCGVGMTAGHEQVRVARALRGLPAVAAAFAEGRLSYSKVRAVTRFATPETEIDAVAIAECAPAAELERLQRSMRRARTSDDVRRRHAARGVRWHYDDDGSVVGSFRLPPDEGARFLLGLDAARDRLPPIDGGATDASAEASTPERRQERSTADALVLMADTLLAHDSAEACADQRDRYQLVLHSSTGALAVGDDASDTDDGPGSELADGTRIAPATARRLACDCPTSTIVDGPDGHALHVGRRHRRIRGRLARAVHARDRDRCRAPGCSQRATQIHHIRHWANGGSTCLANLISLCDHHHWLVHEGGFTILTRRPGQWALLSPAGITVDPVPANAALTSPLPHNDGLRPDAVSGDWDGTRLDVHAATAALTHPAPPAPRPEAPSGPPAVVTTGPSFDWETLNRWYDDMLEMERRAAESGSFIVVDEDET